MGQNWIESWLGWADRKIVKKARVFWGFWVAEYGLMSLSKTAKFDKISTSDQGAKTLFFWRFGGSDGNLFVPAKKPGFLSLSQMIGAFVGASNLGRSNAFHFRAIVNFWAPASDSTKTIVQTFERFINCRPILTTKTKMVISAKFQSKRSSRVAT